MRQRHSSLVSTSNVEAVLHRYSQTSFQKRFISCGRGSGSSQRHKDRTHMLRNACFTNSLPPLDCDLAVIRARCRHNGRLLDQIGYSHSCSRDTKTRLPWSTSSVSSCHQSSEYQVPHNQKRAECHCRKENCLRRTSSFTGTLKLLVALV